MADQRADLAGTPLQLTDIAQVVVSLDERDGQALFGFARRLGLAPDEADDAVQEVLLRLFRALQAGTQVADPRAWSFRALYRIAMDEHRLRRRLGGIRERLARMEDRQRTDDRAVRISLWNDVDRLPARQRQVLYLRYKADLSFADIATVMNITAGGARAVANKALQSLRAVVDQPR
jgi:RNA polymerase sigma factor (sigma-70 family)